MAEGDKLIADLLNSQLVVQSLFATNNWQVPGQFQESYTRVSPSEMERIALAQSPQNVLGVFAIPKYKLPVSLNSLSLFLDQVADPGNLGTILRTADWFGLEHVFCSPDCADAWNPKVVQASMGSVARVRIHYVEPETLRESFPGLPWLAAALSGENVFEYEWPENCLLLIGNEAHGIRKNLLALTDRQLSIPGYGKAESLNAAIAAGICCALYFRGRVAG